jgi:hypothetical protein
MKGCTSALHLRCANPRARRRNGLNGSSIDGHQFHRIGLSCADSLHDFAQRWSASVNSFEWSFELIGLGFIALCLCVFVFSSRLPPEGRVRDTR